MVNEQWGISKKQVIIYALRKENERGVGLILANDMKQLHKARRKKLITFTVHRIRFNVNPRKLSSPWKT